MYTFQIWTGPITSSIPKLWPNGCRFHTLSPLFDPESVVADPVTPLWMVLLWGKASINAISQSTWALNVVNWTWKKIQASGSWLNVRHSSFVSIQLNEELKPRAWHIACPHHIQRDIIVIGGNRPIENDYYKGRHEIADFQLIPFG